MPIRPNLLERTLFFTLNLGPGLVLDIWSAVGFQAVLASVRLGLFETLSGSPQTLVNLAKNIEADPDSLRVLLNALEALGYVRLKNGIYCNTPMTTKWLTDGGEANFKPYIQFWGNILPELWWNLDESIRMGKAPINIYEWIEEQPETSRFFQEGMVAIAKLVGDEIVGKVKLPSTAKRLLDVGGGHGMYASQFCEKHPHLSAVIFDSPQALVTGMGTISKAGLDGRITLQQGDFLNDEFGNDYDIVLLFNIIHGFTPEQNTELFRKALRALNPGGQIVVLEQLAGSVPDGAANATNALLGLAYFHTLSGMVYSYEEVSGWLQDAGFTEIKQKGLLKGPGSSLIIGSH